MAKKVAVVAVGGNSLIKDEKHATVSDQYLAAVETMKHITSMLEKGWEVVITHGNGPQVGFILARSEAAEKHLGMHPVPLDSCGADSQGAIGYNFQQALTNEFRRRGINKNAVTVVTRVLVDAADPAFKKPTKPIGSFMTQEKATGAHKEKGWFVVEDAGRGWRRVVPSPLPTRIVELEAIRTLVNAGVAVVAVGGGGIPVVEENGVLKGTAAVIDKDRASALLANNLNANYLIISTAVEKAYVNYGKPNQQPLDTITLEQAKQYMKEGHFKPGSMLPKMESAIQFIENGGTHVIITSPEKLLDAVHGKTGTHIVR